MCKSGVGVKVEVVLRGSVCVCVRGDAREKVGATSDAQRLIVGECRSRLDGGSDRYIGLVRSKT